MQLPSININGTNAVTLYDEAYAAYIAVRQAKSALIAMTVHGRDYPAGNIQSVLEDHRGRVQALQQVENDLLFLSLALNQLAVDERTKS